MCFGFTAAGAAWPVDMRPLRLREASDGSTAVSVVDPGIYVAYMAERRWRGTWWVAGEDKITRQGTLIALDDGALKLELIGGFDISVRQEVAPGVESMAMESRTFPLILGHASGQLISLLGCHAAHTQGGFFTDSITEQDIGASRALIGVCLEEPDEPIFVSNHLWLEYLLEWSGRTSLRLPNVPNDQGVWPGDRTAHVDQVEPESAEYGPFKLTLRVRGGGFGIKHSPALNWNAIEARESAHVDFEVETPVSYDAFDTIDKDVQDLLTLAAYEACGTRRQSLCYHPSVQHPGNHDPIEVEVIGKQTYRRKVPAKEPFHHNFLFTLADAGFAELIHGWLDLKERSRMGSNIMFGLRYISTGYVGNRLLGIASAAESLHALTEGTATPPLPPTTFDRIKQMVIGCLEDEPADVMAYVKNALHNRAGYKARLLDLAAVPDQRAVDELIFDRDAWARLLRDARNDLAHANERSSEDPGSTLAFWLLEATYALLSLVMLSRLGLSAEAQRRAVRHAQFAWVAKHFQGAVQATSTDDRN